MDELCLVTGGAGFIGSHLVDELVKQGKTVRVLDDLSTGLRDNLTHHEGGVELVEGSLTDPAAIRKAIEGVKTIFHLGALASVARSVENPRATHDVCVTGTLELLDAARKSSVRRVVYAASSSAYGGSTGDEGQIEAQPLSTRSPYAAAKLAGELYLEAFAHTYGLETVRMRFFNIFGPRQRSDSPYSGVIALFIAAMAAGKTPTIHGDGLQSRDFTYVANAVQALIRGSEVEGISGRVYNVGTGNSTTVLDLVASLNRIFNSNIEPKFADPRAGDVRYSRANIDTITSELGYKPTVLFDEGLAKTVDWQQSN